MKLETLEKFNKLVADNGKHIRMANDTYIPASTDEEGNEIEEHIPNYFTEAYVPKKITEENMWEKYVEEENPIEESGV